MDIVFFFEVCDEFITLMCCPFSYDDTIITHNDMVTDVEQGLEDEDLCECNLCHLIREGHRMLF
ncbi:MAG: hypothetical protein ACOVRN_00435, partial [Flavobacterium sp.]